MLKWSCGPIEKEQNLFASVKKGVICGTLIEQKQLVVTFIKTLLEWASDYKFKVVTILYYAGEPANKVDGPIPGAPGTEKFDHTHGSHDGFP